MAQTKRKRRTKHRGNAAGMIEVRGRTGKGGASGATGAKGTGRTTGPGGKPIRTDRWGDEQQEQALRQTDHRPDQTDQAGYR